MPIEQFTREEFEVALEAACYALDLHWTSRGLISGEWCYDVVLDASAVIRVRSSVWSHGRQAPKGEDSIRLYLIHADTETPIGVKVDAWTTRVKGWERRVREKLHVIQLWRKIAGDCDTVGCEHYARPRGLYRVKKPGPNRGRAFAKCYACNSSFFAWLPESRKEIKRYNAGVPF